MDVKTEAIWRSYVNEDPELRAMERHKRKIAYRRLRKAHARMVRAEALRCIVDDICFFLSGIISGAAIAALLLIT